MVVVSSYFCWGVFLVFARYHGDTSSPIRAEKLFLLNLSLGVITDELTRRKGRLGTICYMFVLERCNNEAD